MTDNADHFDEFEPHTLLKHRVLDAYLSAWCMKLFQGGVPPDKLWFLDGFAGAGQDNLGNPGSPKIACQVALRIRGKPGEPPRDLGVFCIEKERQYFEPLAALMRGFREQAELDTHARHGEFTEHCNEALRTINGRPVLAFLDPFGIKGLSAELYRPLLAVRRSEIFMLVADAGAARLSGVLNADDRKFEAVSARILAAPSLFADHDAKDLEANEAARARREATLERTKAGILRTLGEALGESAAAELAALPIEEMSTRYVERLERVLREAGATHVVKFRVRDAEGTVKHLLLHACGSRVGAITMKQSINAALNREDLDADLRRRLREDLTIDVAELVDECERVYAGTAVPLAIKEDGSLQAELLAATPLFPHQWPEVKGLLKARGHFRKIDRKDHAVFPARS
jgi:three-Cys-motif partner protein